MHILPMLEKSEKTIQIWHKVEILMADVFLLHFANIILDSNSLNWGPQCLSLLLASTSILHIYSVINQH